jgi:hypothetical protein
MDTAKPKAVILCALSLLVGACATAAKERGGPPSGGDAGAAGDATYGPGDAGIGGGAGNGAGGRAGQDAAGGSAGSGAGGAGSGATPPGAITIHLEKTFDGATTVSFGLPLVAGAVKDTSAIRVSAAGNPIAATIKPIVHSYDAKGQPTGLASVLVQFPASVMPGDAMDVDVSFDGTGPATQPFASVSATSDDVAVVADRTIQNVNGQAQLVETGSSTRKLFTGREPRVLATFPDGYLASTGILGRQMTASQAHASDFAGLSFFSDALSTFALSAMYVESYKVSSYLDPTDPYSSGVVDPVANYEGWLYDRCATFLTGYVHTGDARFLRHAYRSCSWYAGEISLSGSNLGIFTGKPDPDTKYSHLRGLYAYYALTGDEGAFAAGKAIADMWLTEPYFVMPYRQGHLRGQDKLWTERLLGTSLEGLWYGSALTGDPKYLGAFEEMFETAYAHITGDAATLAKINPGYDFPPQNCFIHSALQHAEGNATDPWCSGWMSELVVDALLRYEDQTGDVRADEIFVRLARFLRDTGTTYFQKNPLGDEFLSPSVCYDPSMGDQTRQLVPLYGSGLRADGTRDDQGEWDDFEHCADSTAMTAAALRALKREGKFDAGGPIGPFSSEGASFLALHHEFAACAQADFVNWTRTMRDPASWSSSQLSAGLSDPQKFIAQNKIGFPSHPTTPLRKLSWWFNSSMLQFGLLEEAGITVPKLEPGQVQKAGCP